MASLVKNFDNKNYPFYYQVETNNLEIPNGIKLIDQYNSKNIIFSVALIKSIFALWEVNPSQRKQMNFVFTKVTNESNESTVAFKVSFDNKVAYYDYSGGPKFNILDLSKLPAASVK